MRPPRRGLLRATAAALAAGVLLAASACASAGPTRASVVVTTNILGDVVGELVGDQADVTVLMKPNADPHSFEISAQEAAALRDADLAVANGLGLEEGLNRHLEAAAADGTPAFLAGEHLEVIDYAEGDAAGTPDPHFWTDPTQMTSVVEALTQRLRGVDGIDEAELEASSAAYLGELEELDREMHKTFSALPSASRALVTNHHVFGYLAKRYDFTIVGAAIPGGTTLAAPSAADLSQLSRAIEQHHVPTIFAESSQPDRLVRVLADEADIEVRVERLFTESLTRPGEGADTYLTMMRANTERIATGLAPAATP